MKVFENISLRSYNTFGIDVSARRLIELDHADSIPHFAEKPLVVGAGSNIVFTRDYDGTIVTLSDSAEVELLPGSVVRVWGGMRLDALIGWCVERGLYGLENLSAIPGTVGAAVVQNAGAYGVETKDRLLRVEAVNLGDASVRSFSAQECAFGYRDSLFKHTDDQWLITHVCFRLADTFTPVMNYKNLETLPHATAAELRQAVSDLRWRKLPRPEEHGSAGSFFKNPVVDEATYRRLKADYPSMPDAYPTQEGTPSGAVCYKLSAGWLIDHCGWKGKTLGRAGVWPHQALVLYNTGGCTGHEVVTLAQTIQQDVKHKLGVDLVPEAMIV